MSKFKPVTIMADNKEVEVKYTEFSDGTFNLNVGDLSHVSTYFSATIHPETNPQSVLLLASMLSYAARKVSLSAETTLYIPYLPNARADRVFVKGDSTPLNDFLTLLELTTREFDTVSFEDVHNESCLNPYNRFLNREAHTLWTNFMLDKYDIMVIPDAGAVGRCSILAGRLGIPTLTGVKKRNIHTGKITDIGLLNKNIDLTGKRVVVFDDICDGGGTFIPYASDAKKMEAESVDLIVTHGIFPKGLLQFTDHFDKIHVRNFIGGYVNATDLLQFNTRK